MNRGLEISADAADAAQQPRPRPGLGRGRGADVRALPPARRREGRPRERPARSPGRTWYAADGTAQRGDVLLDDGVIVAGRLASTPRRRRRARRRRRPRRCCPASSTCTPTCASRAARTPRRSPPGSRPRPPAASPPCSPWPTPPRSPTPPRPRSASSTSAGPPRLVDVVPVGAVTKGLDGARARRARASCTARGPGVRVFSDDGHCVADGRVMRRALEYVRPSAASSRQHSQDPRLAGPHACCHEGELSGRLGLPGWPAVAEASRSSPATSMLAEHTGVAGPRRARQHRRGLGRRRALGQGAGHRDHRRGHPAPPRCSAPTCSPATTRSSRSTRRCGPSEDRPSARRGPARRHHRRGRHRPRPARAARQGARLRRRAPSGCSASRPPSPWCTTCSSPTGGSTGPTSRGVMSVSPARIAGLADHGQPVAAGAPANLVLVDPDRDWSPSTATPRSPCPATPRGTAARLTGARPHDDPAGGTP